MYQQNHQGLLFGRSSRVNGGSNKSSGRRDRSRARGEEEGKNGQTCVKVSHLYLLCLSLPSLSVDIWDTSLQTALTSSVFAASSLVIVLCSVNQGHVCTRFVLLILRSSRCGGMGGRMCARECACVYTCLCVCVRACCVCVCVRTCLHSTILWLMHNMCCVDQ